MKGAPLLALCRAAGAFKSMYHLLLYWRFPFVASNHFLHVYPVLARTVHHHGFAFD